MEDVRKASTGPVWYQLYLVGGREVAMAGIERARKAGYSALVVTIDTAVAGMRERDLRNGMKELLSWNLGKMLPYVPQFLARPRWLASFLADGGLMKFPNVVLPGEGPMGYADVGTALEASTVTWPDLRWIRDAWNGKIVVKGVHIGEDARRAVDAGADAVVVSNHGGRQLDGVHADAARPARSRGGGERARRGPAGRRHPPRQRRREGAVPWRAGGARRPRVRVRARRRRRRRRRRARSRSSRPISCARSSCSDVRRPRS